MKFAALFSACILPLSSMALIEVTDTAELPFLNPDLENRSVAKYQLNNQLEILLISDPSADLSSATMAVEVGTWNDPVEYPGMAHFCEHMLFMGSQKYPDENAFTSLLSNYGGTMNAFTASDRTVYMFSSREEGFLSLLDHFARFYIDPLFNPSSISRELHAVDQEFAKNIQHDGWRLQMIWKETGNPEHPNRMFSTGNSETLSHIPQSALQKWYQEHYGSNRMHLAIYSSLSIETMRENVAEMFKDIPQLQSVPVTTADLPLSSSRQKGHITYVTPFQNLQIAILSWELPFDLAEDPSQPAQLLAYSLDRGQKNNLKELLKKEQLIDDLSFSSDTIGGNRHRFFQIQLNLSDKGMAQFDTVVQRCFQALATFKEEEVPSYLFDERNAVAKLHYQYQSRQDAFSYIQSVGEALIDESLSSFPRAQLLGSEYLPETLSRTAAFLTAQNCAITLIAPPEKTKVPTDRKERWLGAEYAVRPFSSENYALWSSADPHPALQMPKPNPFIPAQLAAYPIDLENQTPILLSENEFGRAYYARCPEFLAPEVSYFLHILTPAIQEDARSQALALLYLDHYTDQINPTLATAAAAGIQARFVLDRSHLQIQLSGFSDKAPLLLEEILKNLKTCEIPTPEQFELYYSRNEKEFANKSKELSFRQARELLDSLTLSGKPTSQEKLEALRTIRYEDFTAFCKTLFDKTYMQAIFAGNLSQQMAMSSWVDALHALAKKPYPKHLHPQIKSLRLNEEKGPYRMDLSTQVQGNAALLLIDQGSFTFERRGAQEILASALKEAFFQELRTQQKTGYIAISDAQEIEGGLFQTLLVQSNTHQPEDLLYRFEQFLEKYLQNFSAEINEARFKTLQDSAIASLKNRFRNLKMKAALYDLLAFQHQGDFSFIEKRIEAIQQLNYSTFTSIASDFISRENRKRLALLFEGKVPNAFAYESLSPAQISEVANYEPRFPAAQELEEASLEGVVKDR